ncbi:hypothetical protein CSUB01_10894 [Colletotrichum sublineola]|uniref:Uncharacterized protein n=1 Tax=Colletotrichum sublineola TaxID=1173701 RepID=A0A066X1X6_COLSU|nr:hypothetical protein CSUB01_10894 [Colletotrichum sublineola]
MEDDEEKSDRLFQPAPSPPVVSPLPPRPNAEEGEQADGPLFPLLDTPARPSIAQNGSRRASSVGGNPNLNMQVDGLQPSSVPLYFDDNGFDDDDDGLPVDDGGGFYSPGGRNQAGNGEGDAALCRAQRRRR